MADPDHPGREQPGPLAAHQIPFGVVGEIARPDHEELHELVVGPEQDQGEEQAAEPDQPLLPKDALSGRGTADPALLRASGSLSRPDRRGGRFDRSVSDPVYPRGNESRDDPAGRSGQPGTRSDGKVRRPLDGGAPRRPVGSRSGSALHRLGVFDARGSGRGRDASRHRRGRRHGRRSFPPAAAASARCPRPPPRHPRPPPAPHPTCPGSHPDDLQPSLQARRSVGCTPARGPCRACQVRQACGTSLCGYVRVIDHPAAEMATDR